MKLLVGLPVVALMLVATLGSVVSMTVTPYGAATALMALTAS